ncbi:MAG: hypothetical protein ACOY0T_03760 [Myxococcota bacterium]
MLKQSAMGDTPAPASKKDDPAVSDSRAPVGSQVKSYASPRSESTKLPISERAKASSTSTAPPTDDIDSEWPSDEESPKADQVVGAATSALDEVDSGWGAEPDETDGALVSPTFPADPALPRDLKSPSGVPSSRPAPVAEVPPSKREMDTVPAAPQASRPPGSVNANSSARLRAAAEAAAVEAAAASVRSAALPRSESTAAASTATSAASVTSEATTDLRQSVDPHVHAPVHFETRSPSRAPIVFALVAAAGVALWLLRPAAAPEATQAKVTSDTAAAVTEPAARVAAPTPVAPPDVVPQPAAIASAAPAAPEAAPLAANAPAAEAQAAPLPANAPVPTADAPAVGNDASAPAPSAGASSGDTVSVVISVRPPQARVFYRGKEVGKPPVTVEVERGKRRSFEVALPGFMTRKVIIDGSKPEVQVGLRPDPAASPAGATP